MAQHEAYVKAAADARATVGLELVFYGDSIMERWRGTKIGIPADVADGIPALYVKFFGKYRSDVFAQSGAPLLQNPVVVLQMVADAW